MICVVIRITQTGIDFINFINQSLNFRIGSHRIILNVSIHDKIIFCKYKKNIGNNKELFRLYDSLYIY